MLSFRFYKSPLNCCLFRPLLVSGLSDIFLLGKRKWKSTGMRWMGVCFRSKQSSLALRLLTAIVCFLLWNMFSIFIVSKNLLTDTFLLILWLRVSFTYLFACLPRGNWYLMLTRTSNFVCIEWQCEMKDSALINRQATSPAIKIKNGKNEAK